MNKLTGIISGIAIFIFLFYNQEPGLNVSIFSLAVWLIICFSKPRKKNNFTFWFLSSTLTLSACSWAWYGDPLSFFALLLSIIATAWHAQLPALNFILYPFALIINIFTLPFRILFITHWLPKKAFRFHFQKWIATIAIPVFLFILFSIVYSSGSSLIAEFFANLFTFKVDQFIGLSILGFFILFSLRVIWIPRFLIQVNMNIRNDFGDGSSFSGFAPFQIIDKKLEMQSGRISLIVLNILLLIFILTYNYEQFFIPSDESILSTDIHDRVNTIIVSILLAIGLILFYFRATKKTGTSWARLRFLAYIWIILNALLVVSAVIKNAEYISVYGLTFKRISVFIFLLLAISGLALSWYKIEMNKTNSFLINRAMWSIYLTIILTAPVNFSWIVTKYNLEQMKTTDMYYLQRLDFNKKILNNHLEANPEWEEYLINTEFRIEREKKKNFLSGHLYYKWFLK